MLYTQRAKERVVVESRRPMLIDGAEAAACEQLGNRRERQYDHLRLHIQWWQQSRDRRRAAAEPNICAAS